MIYFEARGEGSAGQKAVGEVVMNRVDAGYAKDVCAVVHQRGQFSWTKHPLKIRDWDTFMKISDLAYRLLAGFEGREDRQSLHFYAGRAPKWATGLRHTKRIRNHMFLQ